MNRSERHIEIFETIKSIAPETKHHLDAGGYSWDESGCSNIFADCYAPECCYCPETKSWYVYDNGAWRRDTEALLAQDMMEELYRLLVTYAASVTVEDRRVEFLKYVAKMGDIRFQKRVLESAKAKMRRSASVFDANPYLINCLNGTINLKDAEHPFKEHDYQDYITMQTNFEFTEQEAHCPRWEKFVDEVMQGDRDKALYLQKALGYSMLGVANEECMFILHGKTTRNGKSTMLSAIHHLLGDYASVTPASIICKSGREKDGEAATPTLASLKGKRFVTMAESSQYGKLDEELIKQLTGGEAIKARNLHENPITYVPQFTLWLSCNDLPSVQDKSLFASDRVRVVEFNRHFSPEEQDKNLKAEFQTQDAMAGIMNWLIDGYYRYVQEGLTMSPAMQKVIRQYVRDNDIVLQFLEELCEPKEGEAVRAKSLYDRYKIWCKSNGYFVCSAKKFNAEMEAHPEWHGGKVIRNGYPHYKDLALKGGAA